MVHAKIIVARATSSCSEFVAAQQRMHQTARVYEGVSVPLVMRRRWTDGRNQEHRITRTKNRSHRAAPRIGVVWNHVGVRFMRMGSLGRRRAVRCLFRRRRQLAARAVGAATLPGRAGGWSDQVGVRLAHRGSLGRRRVSGVRRDARARSMFRGCAPPVPSFVRAYRSLGSWGSSRRTC